MNQEEFNVQYNNPANLWDAYTALSRFIDHRGKLCIPPTPDDDDMLISRALSELYDKRILMAKFKATGSELLLQYENIYGGETELSKEFSLLLESI